MKTTETMTSNEQVITPLFQVGRTFATPGAIKELSKLVIEPTELIKRHVSGDWSEMEQEDQEANKNALENDSRIFSAYKFNTLTIWVITEADRHNTTLLLPEEY